MNDIDEQIRAALKEEDADLLSRFEGDAPLHIMLIELYQGRRRWLNMSATIATFGLFALMLWCGNCFFAAESTRDMIAWATGFLTLFMWIVMMKLWFWLEMVKNTVTREMKRVELQIALLSETKEQPQ